MPARTQRLRKKPVAVKRRGTPVLRPVRRKAPAALRAMQATVQRAVSNTLNLEVKVSVANLNDGLWGVTMLLNRHRSTPLLLQQWEMDAMLEVVLVPAHKRGIFMRLYRNLEASAGQAA